jgi:hypothetical protein
MEDSMKTTITNAVDFVRAVEISPIAAQPGHWQVEFSSQLHSAKNTLEWQRNLAMTLQESELRKLRDSIDKASSQSVQP